MSEAREAAKELINGKSPLERLLNPTARVGFEIGAAWQEGKDWGKIDEAQERLSTVEKSRNDANGALAKIQEVIDGHYVFEKGGFSVVRADVYSMIKEILDGET